MQVPVMGLEDNFRDSCGWVHGVPSPMYFKEILTDGGEANKFISAISRGRSKN